LSRRLLFPWPYSPSTLYNHYSRLLRRAGLPDDRKSKPQRMRRSFASHLEAAGGNATAALKHSSRKVTERAYLDPRIVGGQNHARLLPRIDPPHLGP
jgi:integrase